MRLILIVAYMCCSCLVFCQLPQTELILFDYIIYDSKLKLESPMYLSDLDDVVYHNQPHFNDAGQLYAVRGNDQGTDIDLFDLDNQLLIPFTRTDKAMEYSPTVMPDGLSISAIRQVGKQQLLWAYPTNRNGSGYNILPDFSDIGYHVWLNSSELVVFRVTDPISMYHINIDQKTAVLKLNDIGRCFQLDKSGNLYFVHKLDDNFWYLKQWNTSEDKIKSVAQIDTEDFVLLKNGDLLCGVDSKLMLLQEGQSSWREVANLEQYGISNITRLATHRNKLVIVNNK